MTVINESSVHDSELVLFSILIQLIVMIGTGRALNTVFRALKQPGVIGEIVAGLLLGPSLFGYVFPDTSLALFGAKPSVSITIISQIGLILLMFQIGSEFEFTNLKSRRSRVGILGISAVSVAMPFLLGFLIGVVSASTLAPGADILLYSLFCGTALAITAVPTLGRILREFDLTQNEIGVVAISAAAINDVFGWLILASISSLAAAQFSGSGVALQIGGLLGLAGGILLILRPIGNWLLVRFPVADGDIPSNLMAVIICLIFVLGIFTYKLGIFTIFGGFAAGWLFHAHRDFVDAWHKQVGRFVLVFFLPVFFTYTGLRINIFGLSSLSDFFWLGIILVAAIGGKIVPVYLVAQRSGFNRHESLTLGVLMNTRALMELIVLNVGYDLGVIPQKVFTMMVVMAVVTTLMTAPLLRVLLARVGHEIPIGREA